MLEVVALTVLALLAWAAFAVGLFLLKALLWLVLLPFRLLFGLIVLPLLLVKLVLGGILFLVLAPVLLLSVAVGILGVAAAAIVPLLPLLFIAGVIWLLVRLSRPAPAVTRV